MRKTKIEFNVGDRVVCMTRVNGLYDTEGIAGTVVASYERGYGVVFDVNVVGHSSEGRCPYGYGLWVDPENLPLLHPVKKASEVIKAPISFLRRLPMMQTRSK